MEKMLNAMINHVIIVLTLLNLLILLQIFYVKNVYLLVYLVKVFARVNLQMIVDINILKQFVNHLPHVIGHQLVHALNY